MEKKCITCKSKKPLHLFWKDKRAKGGRGGVCIKCRKHYKRALYYGLDIKEYRRLLREQGGACAICGKKPEKRDLGVDHDHKTKRVRGLLCIKCNLAVGWLEENTLRLKEAMEYLDKA